MSDNAIEYRIVQITDKEIKPLYYFYCVYSKPVFRTTFHGAWRTSKLELAEQVLSHIKQLVPSIKIKIIENER